MEESFLVQTPYGKAKVLKVLSRGSDASRLQSLSTYELELIDWNSPSERASLRSRPRLFTSSSYPSVSPRVGSRVMTIRCFQRPMYGRVLQVRPLDQIAVVRLYDWYMVEEGSGDDPHSGNVFVTCYFSYNSLQVLADEESDEKRKSKTRKSSRTVSKLLDIQNHQNVGYQLYRSHKWELAWQEFNRASSLIAELLTTKQKTLIRGNLMLHCIKCCNYMAVCKLWLNEQTACIKHCMDALYLMRSLEVKGKRRYRDYFGKYSGEVRVFGCWRIKAMQIMAHVFMEKKQFGAAKDLLKQAHKNAKKHQVSPDNLELEKRIAQLARIDRATLRLFTVLTRQQNSHAATEGASRLWLLDDQEDDHQWPPLPINENATEAELLTPTRRNKAKVTSFESPDTYLTEASSFDTADHNANYADEASCDTQDTTSSSASFFRNLLQRKNAATVPALIPSDSNVFARDNKVFRARKQYLDKVVKKTNLAGKTITASTPSTKT